jgi:prepilin-type N-terminal cleavage/methylation domain-containing protein
MATRVRSRRTARSEVGDAGFTLIELVVALTLAVIIISLVSLTFATAIRNSTNATAAGVANDNAVLALNALQRQVVSADIIYSPSVKTTNAGSQVPTPRTTAGFALRMLSSYKSSSTPTCIQWRLESTGKLQERSWRVNLTTTVTGWKTVVSGLKTTSTPPFAVATTSAYASRALSITFILAASPTSTHANATTKVASSVASLDAEFYNVTAPQFCSPPSPTTPTT